MNALELIKGFESCRLLSYQDDTGRWTVGWGATGPNIGKDTVWSQLQADTDLRERVDELRALMVPRVRAPLTEGQWAACLSLAYNIGIAGFEASTVLRRINAYDYSGAADAFLLWDESRSGPEHTLVIDESLVKRRKDERAIFLQSTPTPPPYLEES